MPATNVKSLLSAGDSRHCWEMWTVWQCHTTRIQNFMRGGPSTVKPDLSGHRMWMKDGIARQVATHDISSIPKITTTRIYNFIRGGPSTVKPYLLSYQDTPFVNERWHSETGGHSWQIQYTTTPPLMTPVFLDFRSDGVHILSITMIWSTSSFCRKNRFVSFTISSRDIWT